jgi:hypothetical protein
MTSSAREPKAWYLTVIIARHLTEVEESLRIAKQLILTRLPDVDLSLELKRARNGEERISLID